MRLTILLLIISLTARAQVCPDITVTYSGQVVTYCAGITNPLIITGIPCTPAQAYQTVSFSVTESPYQIHLWSNYNYVEFPNTPINIPFIGVIDECNGDLIYYSGGGACSVGSSIGGVSSGTEFTLMLNLPIGDYIAVIGFWASQGNFYGFEGCIEYTFGAIGFLDGAEPEPEVIGSGYVEPSVKYVPRYTKLIIEGRGVFILDSYTGELYDITTRRIMPY